jgi:hypothetical protein
MQVRIARSAETDLLEGYAFYEEQQAGIGEYFLDSLFAAIGVSITFFFTRLSSIRRSPANADFLVCAIYFASRLTTRGGLYSPLSGRARKVRRG